MVKYFIIVTANYFILVFFALILLKVIKLFALNAKVDTIYLQNLPHAIFAIIVGKNNLKLIYISTEC